MDGFLVLFWFLIAGVVFCGLLGSVYYAYVRTENRAKIFARALAAFAVYGLLTAVLTALAGFTLFAAAHSQDGSVLSAGDRFIAVALMLVYVGIAWLMCSFVVGHLVLPNRRG